MAYGLLELSLLNSEPYCPKGLLILSCENSEPASVRIAS